MYFNLCLISYCEELDIKLELVFVYANFMVFSFTFLHYLLHRYFFNLLLQFTKCHCARINF